MLLSFVEFSNVTAWIAGRGPEWDSVLSDLQWRLMTKPDLGAPVPGCNGVRKIRLPDPMRKKGTRGGVRFLYLHVPELALVYAIIAYDKDEQSDLTPDERAAIGRFADSLKKAARSNPVRRRRP